jgi:hypothetical protein
MTKVSKVVKSVAGTALRAAAAAATAVVIDKMTDAIAEKVYELAEAEPMSKKPRPALRKSRAAVKSKVTPPKAAKKRKAAKAKRKIKA